MATESPQGNVANTGSARRADGWTANTVRLSPREWLIASAAIALAFVLLPAAWRILEPFAPGPDYRMPYRLGEDYWHYERYCRQAARGDSALVLGDSVVWGHYVSSEQTLSHHLNQQAGSPRFVNLGLDGIHPAAMAGLIEYYGRAISGKDVVLVCNPLWMSSATHDLQTTKEFAFNHPKLVSQFSPRIPCYKEPLAGRLGIVVERHVELFSWVGHLRTVYLDNSDLATWALDHPYASPGRDPTGGFASPDDPRSTPPVGEPWTAKGIEPYSPRWVDLKTSVQWRSFQRTVRLLRDRGNRVFVLVGPFNEHMLKSENLPVYGRLKAGIGAWLAEEGIPHLIPPPLASQLNADASHPLAEGYASLARQLSRRSRVCPIPSWRLINPSSRFTVTAPAHCAPIRG